MTSCYTTYTSGSVSRFVSEDIELGMDKNVFIKRCGKPFNKELSYTQDNQVQEKLFYKEELYKESWFIVTTSFTFIDNKLVKQKIVKVERSYRECDCDK